MTIAMMIDIETLSLRPDAYVTQVGYCVANLDTGQYLIDPKNSWLDQAHQESRHIDFDTVRWWMTQDKTVAAGVFGTNYTPRVFVAELFDMLGYLVVENNVDEVWASPAMFDLPILTSLWEGKKPWVYSQERCLMTLYKTIDPGGVLAPPPNQSHHDAAADAKWQMDYLISLHQYATENEIQAVVP